MSARSKSCTRKTPSAPTPQFLAANGLDRRGFLGGADLAAIGPPSAAPFRRRQHAGRADPRGAGAGRTATAPPKGPRYLKFPGKDDKLVLLGDRPLVAERDIC
jgi:hypothetical protein